MINSIIEKAIKAAESYCLHWCPYYPYCIYPECERVEFDGSHIAYKLDPFGVDLLEKK